MTKVQELMNKIEEVKAEAKELKTANEINAKIEEVKNLKAQLKLAELEEEEERAEIENKIKNGQVENLNKKDNEGVTNMKNVEEIMAKAIVGTATHEELEKIQNLMSEDDDKKGGLTVPQDVKTKIIELQRKSFDIRKYINIETTKVKKGSRVIEIGEAEAAGFSSVDEGKEIQALHEPTLDEVGYAIRKYAGYIPVTNELLEDSAENILAYINKWMAKNELNTYAYQVFNGTGNKACEGIMTDVKNTKSGKLKDRVEKVDLTNANTIKKFKTVLNKDLDEVDTDNIVIFTNSDGYDFLDGLEDKNGRPYLQEDVTKSSGYKFLNKEIVKVPAKFLANITDTDTRVPFIIGDLKLLYTMYNREQMRIESTEIGGEAWRSDKTEIKGSFRFDGKINGDVKAVKVLLAKLG